MSKIYISSSAPRAILDYFYNKGFTVERFLPMGRTYMPVDCHPDIYMCKMGILPSDEVILANPSEIGEKYPENIPYNAVCTDAIFMHSLKYTSPVLLKRAEERNLELIDVKQGYTKCNTVVVDNNSLITSDLSIYNAAKKHNIDVLKIAEGYVNLKGFPYGFLGGASGMVGNEIVFCGDLTAHPDLKKICDFISERGKKVHYFTSFPLTDIGSIIEEE